MPLIKIFHLCEHQYKPNPKDEVHYFDWHHDEVQEFMRRLMALGRDIIILTNIECDDAHAPCGCYGYDGVCDWHRGHSDERFADCFCSRETKCNYHTH